MIIKKDSPILILRVSSYRSFDFVGEHSKALEQGNGVWLLKTGKLIPEKALNSIIEAGGVIILRTPKKQGGQWYLSSFDQYHIGKPTLEMNYPSYYKLLCAQWEIDSLYGTWLHIYDLHEISENMVSHLALCANAHSVLEVINTTRTAYLYAKAIWI